MKQLESIQVFVMRSMKIWSSEESEENILNRRALKKKHPYFEKEQGESTASKMFHKITS